MHQLVSRYLPLSALLVLLSAGCNSNSAAGPPPVSPYTPIDYAGGASISGSIHIRDKQHFPEQIPIDMAQDPACGLSNSPANVTEQYVIHGDGLANVFVFIKSGLGDRRYAVPTTPVVLDQKGCRYVPHVVGLMAGQTLRVMNSDMTMHNFHPVIMGLGNHNTDITQAAGAKPVDTTFYEPELMIPVRCNNHPWMQAFVNVAANPYYAVSDAAGNFEIRGLPPGTYVVAALHEKIVEKDVTITVAAGGKATADFTLTSP